MRRALSALAAFAVLAAVAAGAWMGYEAVVSQPIRHVVFAGDVGRLPAENLAALSQAIRRSPAGASLESVREAARRVPWVRDAAVRRQFPDTVEITFQAHEALAFWNDGMLLGKAGEAFAATTDAALPRFRGPEGAGPVMLDHYATISRVLAPLGAVAALRLSARGAWVVVLDSGLTLQAGRGDIVPRIERFVAAWQKLGRADDAAAVDLRYPNGFAVRRAASLTVEGAKK